MGWSGRLATTFCAWSCEFQDVFKCSYFCYRFFSEPNKRSIRPELSYRQCPSITKCLQTKARYDSAHGRVGIQPFRFSSRLLQQTGVQQVTLSIVLQWEGRLPKSKSQFPGCTIRDILKNHRNAFDKEIQYFLSFIQRNASIELQKAYTMYIEHLTRSASHCDATRVHHEIKIRHELPNCKENT